VLEDTELVEFPTLLVLTDDELAQGAYNIVDKKDVRNLQRRAEKQSGHAGGEPQADHRRDGETKHEIGAAVAIPPKPEPTPAGAEEDEDEEEGFAFATLVDY
jgi:hypothetical protein